MPTLFAKIHGCNSAAVISNSMGDVTEGKSHQQIEEQFGFVDTFMPQDKHANVRERDWGSPWVRHAHHRPTEMTEDGIEQHRLMCTAIIEKSGRIDVWDLRGHGSRAAPSFDQRNEPRPRTHRGTRSTNVTICRNSGIPTRDSRPGPGQRSSV